jgi:hypothetical protein
MPQLPTLKWKPAPPGRAERLARWFAEWNLVQALRLEHPESSEPLRPNRGPSGTPCPGPEPPVAPFDPELVKGQIRLMDPLLFVEFRRPIYVALIGEWGPNSFLTAPFGPILEPATKTEWLTGHPEHALRVLCLWNARTMPAEVLKRSWYVDDLAAQELQDAWQVFRHAATGADLEDRLLTQVGCAIVHPRDSRLQYQAEETRLFTQMAVESADQGSGSKPDEQPADNVYVLAWLIGIASLQSLRRAAGSPEPSKLKALTSIFLVPSLGVKLVFRMESDLQTVSVKVHTRQGRPSNLLDQASVVNAEGSPVGRIKGNQARISASTLRNGFSVCDANGKRIILELQE